MMTDFQNALVSLLSQQDSVWLSPRRHFRHEGEPPRGTLYDLQQAYLGAGLPWHSKLFFPTADEAERKAAERLLGELARDGLVTTAMPRRSRTLGVKLTCRGDQIARALVGLPGITDAWVSAVEIRDRTNPDLPAFSDRCCQAFGGLGPLWLPETDLAGKQWGEPGADKEFMLCEDMAMGGIVRQWIVVNCSVRGHAWYCPGKIPDAMPPIVEDLPDYSKACRVAFFEKLRADRAAIANVPPTLEIGKIPLPVSMSPFKRKAVSA